MEYEVVDKQGNKRWISEQEAISKGLIKEPKKDTLLQKVNKTWLGSVIGTPATIGSSVMTTPTLSVLDKKNKASLDKARELTAMAKNELDANKRKELLNEARSIMETSGQRTEKSVNALNQGNVYSGLNRETPNTFKEQLNTYAPQGAKTASDIMDLILLGGGYGASGNSLKKILSSGAIGASRGAISQTGSKPTGELSDVNAGDVAGSAALQGLLGMLFTAGAEGVKGTKRIMSNKVESLAKTKDTLDNVSNKYNPLRVISNKVKEEVGSGKVGKVDMKSVNKLIQEEIKRSTTGDKQAKLLKLLSKESNLPKSFEKFVNTKQKLSFKEGNVNQINAIFDNIKKQVYAERIHQMSPRIGDLDKAYSLLKNISSKNKKGIFSLFKILGTGLAGGAIGANLFKNK
jgi:hypothetical protein